MTDHPVPTRRRFRDLTGPGACTAPYWLHASGSHNAITDVAGVAVGHLTLAEGPVQTGVTVILPHGGDPWEAKVFAGASILNGCGEAAGLMWIQEGGLLESPIALTNTMSVGTVQAALGAWMMDQHPGIGRGDPTVTPVVFECDDSGLNDIRTPRITADHVQEALAAARGGMVAEGSVGAGRGMVCYEFKGGIGTASRVVPRTEGGYTVGVLVLANHGRRKELITAGRAAGRQITDRLPITGTRRAAGSIVMIAATDAPLAPHQLRRLAARAPLGLARTGAVAHHGSGDVALAFSTAHFTPLHGRGPASVTLLHDDGIDPLFAACVEATEEAVLNALAGAETVQGRDGHVAHAIPLDQWAQCMV